MVYLNLYLTSNDKTFEYCSLQKDKNYKIALVKLVGEINNSDSRSLLLLCNTNLNVDENNNNIVIEKNNKNTICNILKRNINFILLEFV